MAALITLAADGQTLNVGEPVPMFMTHLACGSGIPLRSQYAVASDGRFLMNVSVDEAAPCTADHHRPKLDGWFKRDEVSKV